MKLEFLDCNTYLGQPMGKGLTSACTIEEMAERMSPLGIVGGLIWHIAQYDSSPQDGNRMIAEAISNAKCVYGCWTVLPPYTGEVVDEEFFNAMKANRIRALRAFPDRNLYMLDRIVFGSFLSELETRKIPLLLSLERGITWPAVYRVLEQFPDLTCVLCDIGVWGMSRYIWPLLASYRNVYVETSLLSLQAGGVESTVERFGAQRLLFGTGFPERYAEAAVLQLRHAKISDSDKMLVAGANLRRLISEVIL